MRLEELRGMIKRAKMMYFDVGSETTPGSGHTYGNGITTRSFEKDYHGRHADILDSKGKVVYTGIDGGTAASITRLRQADGSFKYRVDRSFLGRNTDRARRPIKSNISVVVDSPYKAMRLAKGKVRLDPATASLLDKVQRLKGKHSDSWVPKRFGLDVGLGVDKGIRDVKKVTIDAHKPNYLKMLKRFHPKAYKAGLLSLTLGGGTAALGGLAYALQSKETAVDKLKRILHID